jgi:hypothetical protein
VLEWALVRTNDFANTITAKCERAEAIITLNGHGNCEYLLGEGID